MCFLLFFGVGERSISVLYIVETPSLLRCLFLDYSVVLSLPLTSPVIPLLPAYKWSLVSAYVLLLVWIADFALR